MNGAVFQVSAMITATLAWKPSVVHRISFPVVALTMPSAENIQRHSSAETAVGMAHGTRMLARTSPRPRKAWCITSAMATPMTTSRATETTVKNVVFQNAFQNFDPASPWKMAV